MDTTIGETMKLTAAEERRLAKQAQRGSKDAAGRLLLSVRPLIVKIAGKHAWKRNMLTRLSKVGVDDLAAEYSAWMLERMHRFDPERGRLTTFTTACLRRLHFQIVKRETETQSRRVSAERSAIDETGSSILERSPDWRETTMEAMIYHEDRLAVRRALRRLSPEDRQLIRDRFWRKKRLRELGKSLGVGRERARQLVERAIQRMGEVI
jgi:RNA polymerase sigma-70 factor (ECF subfamily)